MTDRCIVPGSQEGYSESGGEIIPLNIPFNQASLLAHDIGFAVIIEDRGTQASVMGHSVKVKIQIRSLKYTLVPVEPWTY